MKLPTQMSMLVWRAFASRVEEGGNVNSNAVPVKNG